MNERARNLAVGITVLVSLVMLGAMIAIFTTLPGMFQGGYPVRMLSNSTHDIEAGYPVHFAGVRIGYVREVGFTDPADPNGGVTILARIDRDVRLPGNVNAYVVAKGFVGSAWIEIKPDGPARTDPGTGKPLAQLPRDGSVPLRVTHLGSNMIPDELKTAIDDMRSGFKDLGALAKNLNGLLAPGETAATGAVSTAPAAPDARAMLAKLSKTLDGLAATVGDPENQANLKITLANLAKVSAQAPEMVDSLKATLAQARSTLEKTDAAIQTTTAAVDKVGGNIDRIWPKLMDDADKLATLLTALNRIASKLETTDGTAGKLLNDPKLYNNLLEITNQLTSLTKEFRVLLETWEKNGVGIKLK